MQQRRWRARKGTTISAPFSELDIATLDAIAIGLYALTPHQPQDRDHADISPSRPAAIRYLLEWYRERVDPYGVVSAQLIPLQSELAQYWRTEASRRQRHHDEVPKPAIEPWPEDLTQVCMSDLLQLPTNEK